MRSDGQPRCRCRVGPGRFEVRARIERFTEPAVLLLLAEGPSHGYEIADTLEGLLDEGRVDFGNLYRLLRSLEDEGLISSSWSEAAPGPQKRVYELTDEGAALLDAWATSLRARGERITALLARHDAVEGRLHSGAGEELRRTQ
jgi:PadR family transcriptional regulator PadR